MAAIDDETRVLQERVTMVESLLAEPGWALVRDRIENSIAQKQARILAGKCESYEDYKSECAYLRALGFVLTIPDREQVMLERRLEGIEEDDGV